MSILNPEKLFRGMMSGLGVSPEQVIGAINMITGELVAIKADREGFKIAASAMVKRYDERLNAIEHKLDRVLTLLDPNVSARNGIALLAPINGSAAKAEATTHE